MFIGRAATKAKGFTLLEIMLVVLLMGMVSSAIVMTLPNNTNSDKDVDWLAQQFQTVLQFAQDEALVTGNELAIVFEKDSYQFAYYNFDKKKWLAAHSDQFETQTTLPAKTEIQHQLLGSVWDEIEPEDQDVFIDEEYLVDVDEEEKEKALKPQVFVMSSGEVTPFTLRFSKFEGDKELQAITVKVMATGEINLSELEKNERS